MWHNYTFNWRKERTESHIHQELVSYILWDIPLSCDSWTNKQYVQMLLYAESVLYKECM